MICRRHQTIKCCQQNDSSKTVHPIIHRLEILRKRIIASREARHKNIKSIGSIIKEQVNSDIQTTVTIATIAKDFIQEDINLAQNELKNIKNRCSHVQQSKPDTSTTNKPDDEPETTDRD